MGFLKDRAQALIACGVDQRRLVLDAGIGFGKTPQQNWQLLAAQPLLQTLNLPWLAGWSRKSTLGLAVDDAQLLAQGASIADTRLVPSVVAALLAVQGGAKVVRVHDVRATLEALTIWQTVQQVQLTSGAH
jgi:dihydropteroate synthase